MNLHKEKDRFIDVLETIGKRTGLRLDVLEKDYYVVLMLNELAQRQKAGLPAYFKGGSALYKLLENAKRFSEDIDLSVDTRGCSGAQNKKRLNLATKGYASMVRDEGAGRINKSEVITYYTYDPVVEYDKDDTLDRFGRMMIEATSFTISEPVSDIEITPLIYDYATEDELMELSENYGIIPFRVKSISVERIFIDKLFAAEAYVRKSSEQNRAFDAAKHIFDLSVMMNMPETKTLFSDEKRMKQLLDIRMEEEQGRLDGIPGVKPSEFKFFDEAASNKAVAHEYGNMLAVYVFRAEDRIPYADAVKNLHIIHDRLMKNPAWRDYHVSVLAKLEAKKREAAEVYNSMPMRSKSRDNLID